MSLIQSALAATYQITGPGVNPTRSGTPVQTTERILSVVIGVISVIAFIYFAIQIIFAGYEFISAQGDPKRLEGARKRITDGILGIIIIVVAMGLTGLLATLAGIPNVFDLNTFFTSVGL